MIDAAAYTGHWPFRPLQPSDPAGLLSRLSAAGIERALVTPIEGLFYEDPQMANERLAASLQGLPALAPVCVLNPALPAWERDLEVCRSRFHCRAVKLFPAYHRYSPIDQPARDLFKAAGNLGVPVVVQLRVQDVRNQNALAFAPDVSLSDFLTIAPRYRDTQFVLGCIKYAEILELASRLPDLPHVWVEISNLEYVDGLRRIIDRVGTQRLLFGSHTPFFLIESAILKLSEAVLTSKERETITRDNAQVLFGLA